MVPKRVLFEFDATKEERCHNCTQDAASSNTAIMSSCVTGCLGHCLPIDAAPPFTNLGTFLPLSFDASCLLLCRPSCPPAAV